MLFPMEICRSYLPYKYAEERLMLTAPRNADTAMDRLVFLISAVIIPAALLLANLFLRWGKPVPLSSGSDTFLLFVGFDITVLSNQKDVIPLIKAALQNHLEIVYLGLLVCAVTIWILNVAVLEPRILSSFDNNANKEFSKLPVMPLATSWALVGVFIAAHFLTFI